MNEPPVIFFLSWIAPGAGHFLLGQRWRGIAFFLTIAATFAAGLLITEGHAVSLSEHRLAFFAQLFAGIPFGVGYALDTIRASVTDGTSARFLTEPPSGSVNAVIAAIDLGLVFTMVAGLLNLLLALDATDRAIARKEARA